MAGEATWWLRHPDGTRVRISVGGVLIGRAPRCDVVVSDPSVSRCHAVVHPSPEHPMLVPLGEGPCRVDGVAVDEPRSVRAGSRIGIGSLELQIVREEAPRLDDVHWVLERSGGGLFGLTHSPFSIGGAPDDDLRVEGAPAHAFTFYATRDRLSVEAGTHGARLGSRELAPGEVVHVRPRQRVCTGAIAITVVTGGALGDATTRRHPEPSGEAPTDVCLEFLPRGGRLTLRTAGRDPTTIYLPERRCDLVAALLRPPDPYAPGDLVPDRVVAAAVWPGQPTGREEINVLVFRLRRDLLRAGVDGVTLVEREAGGTRFVVPAAATVSIV